MPGLGNAWQAAGIQSSRLDVLVGEDRQNENTSYCSDDKGEEKGQWGFNAFSAVVRGGVAEHRDIRHLGRKSPSHQRECRAQG